MELVKIACPKCESQIDVDSNFCLNCGFTIKNVQNSIQRVKTPVYKSKYTDTTISKQLQDPVHTKIQIIALLEVTLGLFFILGSVIASWIYYFMGYAIEYGKTIESIPFEFVNIFETLLVNIDILLMFVFLYGIFCTIFGIGLYILKKWGMIGSLIVSGIALLYFPIGTIAGGMGIYYLSRKEISNEFK
jgi:hypothetical protein